jgi:hypothetical protein
MNGHTFPYCDIPQQRRVEIPVYVAITCAEETTDPVFTAHLGDEALQAGPVEYPRVHYTKRLLSLDASLISL